MPVKRILCVCFPARSVLPAGAVEACVTAMADDKVLLIPYERRETCVAVQALTELLRTDEVVYTGGRARDA
eukprot:744566-Prorocentrum_minimum.AAC.1